MFGWRMRASTAHLGGKAFEHDFVMVAWHLQHFDGDRAAHENVFAPIYDPHAADAEAVQDAIIAEYQPVHATGHDLGRLIIGDQPDFHQLG